jgi:hypothetical protein
MQFQASSVCGIHFRLAGRASQNDAASGGVFELVARLIREMYQIVVNECNCMMRVHNNPGLVLHEINAPFSLLTAGVQHPPHITNKKSRKSPDKHTASCFEALEGVSMYVLHSEATPGHHM